MSKKVVIIGNGIAGISAARNIRKQSDFDITVISAETEYFYSRTALMYVFMGHMKLRDTEPYDRLFWKKNKINLIFDLAERIDFPDKVVHLTDLGECKYDYLILAVGSQPKPLLNAFSFKNAQGLYSVTDLNKMTAMTQAIQHATVIGGGLIGVEVAEMLLSKNIAVTFVIKDNYFWGNVLPEKDARLVHSHLQKHKGLTLITNDEAKAFIGEQTEIREIKLKSGATLKTDFVAITIGVQPNIQWLKHKDIATDKGVLVDEYLQTNIPNVFAIGDCAQHRNPLNGRMPIEQVWYTGKIMGETVAQSITKSKTKYQPGNWFNSAKFFDLEFQTYGNVPQSLSDNQLDFCWQHHKKDKLLHLVFEKQSQALIGVNAFGFRLRHQLFDHWLSTKTKVEVVLENLSTASFDAEFEKDDAKNILEAYNQQFNTSVQLKKKNWWSNLLTKK